VSGRLLVGRSNSPKSKAAYLERSEGDERNQASEKERLVMQKGQNVAHKRLKKPKTNVSYMSPSSMCLPSRGKCITVFSSYREM
jgi:hypothetical protein